MFKSKYSGVLTIILIIVIVAIIIAAIVVSIKAYNNYKDENDKNKKIAEFEQMAIENRRIEEEENNTVFDPGDFIMPTQAPEGSQEEQGQESSGGGSGTSTRKKTTMYKNYPMIGYIEIEKTKTKEPILLSTSAGALDVGVGVSYPTSPKLNEPGNTVIIGHNYKNGRFFSNNKKLVVGDKIKITDTNGRTLTYTIYEIMTIPESNTEYITRDRGGNTEISLSTCTDDSNSSMRLVILARVQ